MIIEMRALNLAEVKDLAGDLEEKKELKAYLKKFGKLSKPDATKLVGEIKALDNLKVNGEHLVKIVDFLPKNSEDLNKIFNDVSLDEKEINEILEIIKGY